MDFHSNSIINTKTNTIVYYLSTGMLTLLMLMSAAMYVFAHETVSGLFTKLGYPAYIIYPLATLKILGLIAIWTKKSQALKEWAYAGFFFDFILAFSAHISIKDGGYGLSLAAIILVLVSYNFEKKVFT